MRIFRRFMRTNAPAALRQIWTDVRLQLGLVAIGSLVVRPSEGDAGQDNFFTTPWREIDVARAQEARAAIERLLDGFAAIYAGTCHTPPCGRDIRSSVPFKISRADTPGEECACCRRLFEEDTGDTVSDILVVPRLTPGSVVADHALVFCAETPLDADAIRFLHTSSGLYFAQQTIWESGHREEPVAALRPREIECVRWAVTGKTLAEVADVMGLSYRTVRFHLDSARSRYGFSTNQQLFVQAAKDYGLDPDGECDAPRRRPSPPATARTPGRIQPSWAERRAPHDRRGGDRRQTTMTHLPFNDRRSAADRRSGEERRAVAEPTGESSQSAEHLLTPEEIRALLN